MTYDPARLHRNRIIQRLPDTNTYVPAAVRQHVAADQLPASPALRKALRTIDTHVAQYIDAARLPLKAA